MYSKAIAALNRKDEISYYVLGAFCTDGNICIDKSRNSAKCCLASKDFDWLYEIQSYLGGNGVVRFRKSGLADYWLYNRDIYNWLNENGCTPAKSLTLQLPDVPDKFLPDFIRACIDGDGSISSCTYKKTKKDKVYIYTQHVSYICSSSFCFLQSLRSRLQNFGINGSLCEVKKKPQTLKNGKLIVPRNPHFRLTFSGSSALDFIKFAYYDGHKLSMKRKMESAIRLIDYYKGKKCNE